MGDLVLSSLEIRGFRCFRELRIARLGRVNLITGKNGVGKTALLEALSIYLRRADEDLLLYLLRLRDEAHLPKGHSTRWSSTALPVEALFHGRPTLQVGKHFITIGPVDDETGTLTLASMTRDELSEDSYAQRRVDRWRDSRAVALVAVRLGSGESVYIAVEPDRIQQIGGPAALGPPIAGVSIPAGGLSAVTSALLWDGVALTDSEEALLATLRVLTPEVEGITVIGEEGDRGRIPIVRVAGVPNPIPLRSLGEGMGRVFGLALALANSRDGMLLIDEFESGLHYSVLSALWRLIFETARRLNVQIFATTHSWDCIRAFGRAAKDDELAGGLLIRLEQRNGDIVPTIFDEDDVRTATRERIEVR